MIKFVKDIGMVWNKAKTTKVRKCVCLCDCGKEFITNTATFKNGTTKRCRECGYKHSGESNTIHGDKKRGNSTKLYRVWQNMLTRCRNKDATSYYRYGGRGISVCDEWYKYSSFKTFALNNGYRENLTIDRIDNNGNYEPSNIRFVTMKENTNNRQNSIKNRFSDDELSEIIECYSNSNITIKNLSGITKLSTRALSKIIKESKLC